MTATRLVARKVEKIWGRRDLPSAFGAVADGDLPVGEVWLDDPRGSWPGLLVKYLFTSTPLSIPIHLDIEAGKALSTRGDEDETWLILRTDVETCIAIGTRETVGNAEVLRWASAPYTLTDGRQILADGPAFVVERWRLGGEGLLDVAPGRPTSLVMLAGGGRIDGQALRPGSGFLVEDSVDLFLDPFADLLVAYPGVGIRSFAALALQARRPTGPSRRRYRDAPRGQDRKNAAAYTGPA